MDSEKIKELNDRFRNSFVGGKVILSQGISSKSNADIGMIMEKVRTFHNFTKGNDHYGEHDFGSFTYKGDKIFWKIDYYDRNLEYMSEDPADVIKTKRVITIMLAEEY